MRAACVRCVPGAKNEIDRTESAGMSIAAVADGSGRSCMFDRTQLYLSAGLLAVLEVVAVVVLAAIR
jgi:hypothetical protein